MQRLIGSVTVVALIAVAYVTTNEAQEVVLPDYAAQLADLPSPPNDRSLPEVSPDGPVGAYGFSRYVYQRQGDDIVATLIEGPVGHQVRCQQPAQECSYVVLQYETLDDACAAGLSISSAQTANMGVHVTDPGAGLEFNPDRPQMILFAKDGGERIPRLDIGRCDGDKFVGEEGFQPVGAVFNIALSEDHPDAFAGELDNWHIHHNTCAGGSVENANDVNGEVEITATTATPEECRAGGGFFMRVMPTWMMHTYVVPDFDPQGGVFAMFNPSVWPVASSPEKMLEIRTIRDDGAVAAPIINFSFGNIEASVGEIIRFGNADSVPHTVTAGSSLNPHPEEFDSGVLDTGGTFDISFDQPGNYQIFCALHPEMQATVVIN